ncbi:MAG: D-alanine--D-alanine ligase, partial [Prevotellaceae bacterium]|nr:D-alanine--D-alanine ligase [Prevotellaceae bacterium]
MKKKIAIVAGGDSSEHEVSLRSAAGILSFMDAERYDCRIVAQRGQSMYVLDGERQYPVNLHDFSYEVDGMRHTFDFAYITIHG